MAVYHCVYFRFKADVFGPERQAVYAELAALKSKIKGFDQFVCGRNRSFEKMERGYMDGFVMTFENRDAHLRYHEHADHKKSRGTPCGCGRRRPGWHHGI